MKQNGRKLTCAAAASSVLLFAGSVLAEGREDYSTQLNQQRYFNMAENARTFGMAGSSVVTSSDSSSTAGNPAGLGFMKDADVSATYYRDTFTGNDFNTYADVQEDIDGGHVLAAFPIVPTLDGTPKYGTIGIGWAGFRTTSDDSIDDGGRTYSLLVGYGKDLSDALALGYSAAFMHKRFTGHSALRDQEREMTDGVLQTVGLQYKVSPATTVGFDTKYGFGTYDYTYDNKTGAMDTEKFSEDVDSWGVAFGGSHTMGATMLATSVDYTNYNSNFDDDSYAWGFRTGIEQTFTDWLKGRLGYRYQANMGYDQGYGNDNAKFNGFSFGAGVKLMKHLYADYGAEVRAIGTGYDWTHSVSLSVPFSLCAN